MVQSLGEAVISDDGFNSLLPSRVFRLGGAEVSADVAPETAPDLVRQALGERVRELRRAAGLTQIDVATAVGMSRATIIRVEAGDHDIAASRLPALAVALGVDVGALFGQ